MLNKKTKLFFHENKSDKHLNNTKMNIYLRVTENNINFKSCL